MLWEVLAVPVVLGVGCLELDWYGSGSVTELGLAEYLLLGILVGPGFMISQPLFGPGSLPPERTGEADVLVAAQPWVTDQAALGGEMVRRVINEFDIAWSSTRADLGRSSPGLTT